MNIIKRNEETEIGNEIDGYIDYGKFNLRSAFENDVVVDFEIQENIMDYVFYNLNVETKEKVDYPILMTETLGNPIESKKCIK